MRRAILLSRLINFGQPYLVAVLCPNAAYDIENLMLKKIMKRLRTSVNNKRDCRSASYYDSMYADSEEYKKLFWQSRYYSLWTVIADRLRSIGSPRILEIGCGTGQLASLISHVTFRSYVGFDISSEAIAQARARELQDMKFLVDDGLSSNLLNDEYDVVVCTEVLEHIERDHDLLQRISVGTRCICTVPNFDYESHVRFFSSEDEVKQRYAGVFSELDVWAIPAAHGVGLLYFLFDGLRC